MNYPFYVVSCFGKPYIFSNQDDASEFFHSLDGYTQARSVIRFPSTEDDVINYLKHSQRKVLFFDKWFWWIPETKKHKKSDFLKAVEEHEKYLRK